VPHCFPDFSLLYDTGAPTLAPLYDLVSTTVYDLTTRLAMSIDGAARIEQVDLDAWRRLAAEIGIRAQFALRTTSQLVERVQAAVPGVASEPQHQNETVTAIATRIAAIRV
jgi:serine/threonine-protein kinase HipA